MKINSKLPVPTSQARTAQLTARSDARINVPPVPRVAGTPPFPFLSLPAKIREKIYRELLVSPEVVDIDFQKQKLHPAIMRTCRSVFHEAHKILYDENTFLMRIGIPQELKNVVPICAPKATEELSLSALTKRDLGCFFSSWTLTRQEYIRDDRDPLYRGYQRSYLNDLFPRLRVAGVLVVGLNGNWCWGGSGGPKQYHEDVKFPRRLVVSIECSALTDRFSSVQDSIEDVANILHHLPRIQYLEIRCENIPQGMWATDQGIELGEQLQAYFGGMVRRVESMAVIGVPHGYVSVLERMMKGNQPKSVLLSMFEAFFHFRILLNFLANPAFPIDYSEDSPWTKARRAMESGDWEAFRHHRETEIRGLRAAGADLLNVEKIFLHDPVDWRQQGIAAETETNAVDRKEKW